MDRYRDKHLKNTSQDSANYPGTYNIEEVGNGVRSTSDRSSIYDNDSNAPDSYCLPDDDAVSYALASDEDEEGVYHHTEDKIENEHSEEDDESYEELAWQGETKRTHPSPLGLMFRIMSNPIDGLKSLKRSKFSLEKVSFGLFYPLILLAGLSNLSMLFYEADTSAGETVITILFTIISFFFGYYTAIIGAGMLLCKEARDVMRTDYGKEIFMYGSSTLALFYILFRLVPMAAPIIAFFPIWTVYIMAKGVRMFNVPNDKEAQTVGYIAILMIGAPLLWDWILGNMIPQ